MEYSGREIHWVDIVYAFRQRRQCSLGARFRALLGLERFEFPRDGAMLLALGGHSQSLRIAVERQLFPLHPGVLAAAAISRDLDTLSFLIQETPLRGAFTGDHASVLLSAPHCWDLLHAAYNLEPWKWLASTGLFLPDRHSEASCALEIWLREAYRLDKGDVPQWTLTHKHILSWVEKGWFDLLCALSARGWIERCGEGTLRQSKALQLILQNDRPEGLGWLLQWLELEDSFLYTILWGAGSPRCMEWALEEGIIPLPSQPREPAEYGSVQLELMPASATALKDLRRQWVRAHWLWSVRPSAPDTPPFVQSGWREHVADLLHTLVHETGTYGADCCVCYEEKEEDDDAWVRLPCMHKFHVGCLSHWWGHYASHLHCPYCRTPFNLPGRKIMN